MPQQDIDKVLDTLATRIKSVSGIQDVDAFRPRSVTNLPRAVLHYLDTPWELGPGTNDIHHTIQIDIIVAPFANVKRSRRRAAELLNDLKTELMSPLQLIAPPNQTTLGSRGSQAIRNVVYNEKMYLASILIVRYVESTSESW